MSLVCMCVYSGAMSADTVSYESLPNVDNSKKCVPIRCQGFETSLAECVIHNKKKIGRMKVATVKCYDASKGQ